MLFNYSAPGCHALGITIDTGRSAALFSFTCEGAENLLYIQKLQGVTGETFGLRIHRAHDSCNPLAHYAVCMCKAW